MGFSGAKDTNHVVRYILLTTLFPNGTLTANHFDGETWKGPNLPNKSFNFTSFALTPVDGRKAFGLTPDGQIQSYNVDITLPLDWGHWSPNGTINTGGA
jgi:hypothetical protein